MNNAISLAQKYNLLRPKVLALATRRPCPAWLRQYKRVISANLELVILVFITYCKFQAANLRVYSPVGLGPAILVFTALRVSNPHLA
jgi:hypothetical protein